MRIALALMAALVFASQSAIATRAARYPLGDASSLVLKVPEGWNHAPDADSAEEGLTVVMKPEGAAFEIRATPLLIACEPCAADEPTLAAIARQAATVAGVGSKNLALHRVEAGALRGYYFTMQQPEAGLGEFQYVTYGMLGFDGIRLSFTVLSDAASQATVLEAINVLKASRRLFVGPRPPDIKA